MLCQVKQTQLLEDGTLDFGIGLLLPLESHNPASHLAFQVNQCELLGLTRAIQANTDSRDIVADLIRQSPGADGKVNGVTGGLQLLPGVCCLRQDAGSAVQISEGLTVDGAAHTLHSLLKISLVNGIPNSLLLSLGGGLGSLSDSGLGYHFAGCGEQFKERRFVRGTGGCLHEKIAALTRVFRDHGIAGGCLLSIVRVVQRGNDDHFRSVWMSISPIF